MTATKHPAGKKPGTEKKTAAPKKSTRKKASTRKTTSKTKKWSNKVNETSDAMDLENGVFKGNSAAHIARSLKSSARHSHRRKGSPFQSAMSMLNFYINRGGKNLTAAKKKVLEDTKDELRKLFKKEEG